MIFLEEKKKNFEHINYFSMLGNSKQKKISPQQTFMHDDSLLFYTRKRHLQITLYRLVRYISYFCERLHRKFSFISSHYRQIELKGRLLNPFRARFTNRYLLTNVH